MNISAISPTPRASATSTPSTRAIQPEALISTSPIAAHQLATIANTAMTAMAATTTAIQVDRARTLPSRPGRAVVRLNIPGSDSFGALDSLILVYHRALKG